MCELLKINDLDKLKITSITNVIHFKYDKEFYCYKKPSLEMIKEIQEKEFAVINMWKVAKDIEKERKKIKHES